MIKMFTKNTSVFTLSRYGVVRTAVAVCCLLFSGVASAQLYTNAAAISIPAFGTSPTYPSTITVAGGPASISGVVVRLNGVNHTWPDDVGVLLVGPNGNSLTVLNDSGNGTDWVAQEYDFQDGGAAFAGAPAPNGTYAPYSGANTRVWAAPAPAAAHAAPAGTASFASQFQCAGSDGTWSLYVQDFVGGDAGSISGGWEIEFFTATVAGCTDPASCNYDACATVDDGSCVIPGCMNPAACNYDVCNNVDDGSCVLCGADNCLLVNITSGTWNSEISWTLNIGGATVGTGGAPFSGYFCANQLACGIEFIAVDSFGDGWNGAVLTITDVTTATTYVNEIPAGAGETYNFVLDPSVIPGCTDPLANNFDPTATCDDGSCLACPIGDVLLQFAMYDSFGDGWSGAQYLISDDLGNLVASGGLAAGTFGLDLVCLPPGCYFLNVTAGIFPSEISWEAYDQNNVLLFSGGAPTTNFGFSWAGQTGCIIPGCTDSGCNNYNPYATIDDGSCQCPPANDDCANAAALVCGASVTGTTLYSNPDVVADNCGQAVTSSTGVWYTIVGTGDQITVSTCASTTGIDTRLHVFTGACGAESCVAANDDACPGFLSTVVWTSINGTVYNILVSEFGVGQGLEFQLDVTCQPCLNPIPANDECAGAELQIDGVPSSIDLCCVNPDGEATPCLGFTTGYGVWYYLNSSNIACGDADTFNFTLQNVSGANVGMTFFLGGGTCGTLTAAACCPIVTQTCAGDVSFLGPLTPNTDYYMLVYTTDPVNCGTIELTTELGFLGCTDATAVNYDACANIDDNTCVYVVPPVNDDCVNATPIACGATAVGSTGGSTNDGFSPCGFSENGVWYSTTLSSLDLVTISTCGSTIGAEFEIYDGALGCGGLSCVAHVNNDQALFPVGPFSCDFFNADDASFTFQPAVSGTYYIFVYDEFTDLDFNGLDDNIDGAFNLSVACELAVPGCTNSIACNFNPAANIEDGSCDYFSCNCPGSNTYVLEMFDSFGDGWDNGTYTITDVLTNNIVATGSLDDAMYVVDENNFVGGEYGLDIICLANGCYEISVGGAIFNSEISWQLSDAGGVVASGGAPSTVEFSVGGNCGCTDPLACNYDPTAVVNDGSCCFGDCVTLTVTGGFFPSEISWEINGYTGGAPSTTVVCLTDPCVNTFNMFDAFGDGWDNATYTFTDSFGNVIATGTLTTGTSGSANISVGIQGCTDAAACNYNAAASCDDSSCCYENCANFNMFDAFGDGWDSGVATVTDVSTGLIVASATLADGSVGSALFCLPTGCYELSVGGSFFDSEISWTLFGTDSGTISGGAPTTVLFSVGGSNCIPGCHEPSACNYDPSTGINDCSTCDYTSCLGCTYPNATNYNPAAGIDNGSCLFDIANPCPADFNEDGTVGVADLLFFIGQYGTVCP